MYDVRNALKEMKVPCPLLLKGINETREAKKLLPAPDITVQGVWKNGPKKHFFNSCP